MRNEILLPVTSDVIKFQQFVTAEAKDASIKLRGKDEVKKTTKDYHHMCSGFNRNC